MQITNGMVWAFFAIIFAPLFYFAIKKYVRVNKENRRAQLELANKKDYYSFLTKEKMDKCPREDLATAVISSVKRIESEDYDLVYDNLNMNERYVYIIYEAMISIENGKGSIRTFFESDFYEPFLPILEDAFNAIDCRQIGDLMKAAKQYKHIIESGEDDNDLDESDDYSNYNYGDFTNEFMTLIMTLNLNERLTDFINNHRDDFIHEEDKNEDISE